MFRHPGAVGALPNSGLQLRWGIFNRDTGAIILGLGPDGTDTFASVGDAETASRTVPEPTVVTAVYA